jgi:palmitoyltransferase ZDHHC9/14/18
MDQLIDNLIEDARPETSADAHATPQSASVTPIAPNSEGRRSARSTRKSVVTYNVQILAGTAIHTPSKYLDKHHKNVLHGDIKEVLKTSTIVSPKKKAPRPRLVSSYSEEDTQDPAEEQLAAEAAQAAQRRTSSRVTDLRREAFRNLGAVGQAIGQTLTGANHVVHNALRRSASDSHLMGSVRNAGPTSPIRPRTARPGASDNDTPEREAEKFAVKPKSKEWLKAGLYIGQTREFDARLSEAQNRLKKKSTKVKENKVIPLPMFAGERLLSSNPLHEYRNFKLPFDTYHPLPRKIKVDGWVKLHRSESRASNS